jgi:hypothetical protein
VRLDDPVSSITVAVESVERFGEGAGLGVGASAGRAAAILLVDVPAASFRSVVAHEVVEPDSLPTVEVFQLRRRFDHEHPRGTRQTVARAPIRRLS